MGYWDILSGQPNNMTTIPPTTITPNAILAFFIKKILLPNNNISLTPPSLLRHQHLFPRHPHILRHTIIRRKRHGTLPAHIRRFIIHRRHKIRKRAAGKTSQRYYYQYNPRSFHDPNLLRNPAIKTHSMGGRILYPCLPDLLQSIFHNHFYHRHGPQAGGCKFILHLWWCYGVHDPLYHPQLFQFA